MKAESFTKDQVIEFYRKMLLIRKFEEKAGQLYGMGLIGGFCHLSIGQEAVVTGTHAASKPGDAFITSYRDHGLMLACGSDPNIVMAELTGKKTGCSKGKGGSMHIFDIEKKFFGGHGIVGAQVPIGTGIAFANKYKKENNVVFTYFGDGATNQGQVYESFNMASLWQLPVIYIIENNGYAMGTSVQRSTLVTDLYRRGESFGIPGKQVDGMDCFSVYEVTSEAAKYVRSGKGPILLEMKTYRYRGHSMSDPATYRSKEKIENIKQNYDPISTLRKHMIDSKIVSEEGCKVIDNEIRDLVKKSEDFAKNSKEPDIDELCIDVYKSSNHSLW
ncbi:pyruvate dehydrogenase (acetyl-transferring) E1 component subunit alpha [Wolbachia endosymbiont of Cruorifilaria tuberocauda]|uniref:pyruvate dehydrogenase (acetyl-transferring) E1 component subunit alpha n=1 Tax=Wolbachia endosymbiont of Cruorifilaria tuberocauda TaxID=1812111 RepID=UPI00158C1965|nr:pyruvate dehydrogenase (acetyl-transferring) E1 component subunit alpha [Wolbachia endosymbiont of Cruorifilaria tuberocauda]QKX01969.1 pyruvate dehydrogenase (acetyl-transferring) E1 component subunit alpha [Wolbachia endosymbiont of Cruorifilaria tuberocauda]